MFGIELQDVIIAVVFFVLGVGVGALGRVEIKSLWLGKKRHGKKSKH